jgi:hypothetical protein
MQPNSSREPTKEGASVRPHHCINRCHLSLLELYSTAEIVAQCQERGMSI